MTKTYCDLCGKEIDMLQPKRYLPHVKDSYGREGADYMYPGIHEVHESCFKTLSSKFIQALKETKDELTRGSNLDADPGVYGAGQGKVQGDSQVQQGDDWDCDGINHYPGKADSSGKPYDHGAEGSVA